ncbi:hypothetical protein UABAM_04554 [Candidatus Uabimicrobium amorphum]|uniref:Peptidase S74 domain-containing protein n=1 Tax=Uabimicrobium amorphum TaxID=2596890 RepID=A0A5S9F526_UABAM|nr:hypothetical protein [Candidatus Uabimicrobium amorphum]BBM86168.1 hypothetical protein UABAM_04554 [Candidatus Uabimicrobium amorphum]
MQKYIVTLLFLSIVGFTTAQNHTETINATNLHVKSAESPTSLLLEHESGKWKLTSSGPHFYLSNMKSGEDLFAVKSNGCIAIGTNTNLNGVSHRLFVDGSIKASGNIFSQNINSGLIKASTNIIAQNKIGIGTDSPEGVLHAKSTENYASLLLESNLGKWKASSSGTNFYLSNMKSGEDLFAVKSNGCIAIGTNTNLNGVSHRLFVDGSIKASKDIIAQNINAKKVNITDLTLGTGKIMSPTELSFNTPVGKAMTIDKDGWVAINAQPSDKYTLTIGGHTKINNNLNVSGAIGVGTTDPKANLHICSEKHFTSLRLDNHKGNWRLASSGGSFYISNYTTTPARDLFAINEGGNVGIKCSPHSTYSLAVKGKVLAEEVLVALHQDWPDFVFDDSYNLTSLEEVEQQIKKNKHLPDIPSGKEVKQNGIQLGAMQGKLLQKIEELTLYTIQQDKQIKSLKVEKHQMKERMEAEKLEMQKRLEKVEKLLHGLLKK